MGIRKNIKKVFNNRVAKLFKRAAITQEELLALKPKRILIVRPHNQLGDMICATPAIRAIREAFSDAEVLLVCAPINYEAVNNNPHINRVIVFDKKKCRNPFKLIRFIKALKNFNSDLVFVLNTVSYSVTSSALAVVSGSKIIVGNESRPFGFDITRHIYSLEMPSNPDFDTNIILHNLAPLQAIGICAEDLSTTVCSAACDIEVADSYNLATPYWVIHPGAAKEENRWGVDSFAEIALLASKVANVIVVQGPADYEVIQKLKEKVSEKIKFLPVNSIGVCAEILNHAERFLCNDTGMMHLAGAVGVPTLALFGNTDPEIWCPIETNIEPVRGAEEDLNNLDVSFVWDKWQSLPAREDEK